MALQWSLSPPRTCLNDAVRSRYSTHEPKTENLPISRGPAHYSPQYETVKPNPHPSHVTLHMHRGPKTERELTLSDGRDVRRLLPAGPGSYEPADLWVRTRSPQQQQFNDSKMSSVSSARSSARSPPLGGSGKPMSALQRLTGLDETVGPGSYDAKLPSQPPKQGVFSRLKRDANNPIPRPPPLSAEELAALPQLIKSPAKASPRASPGATISKTPRCFNLHNINSHTYRHKDMDFNVPPPGWYDQTNDSVVRRSTPKAAGTFSRSPRRIDLALHTAAPGPGTYDYATSSINAS